MITLRNYQSDMVTRAVATDRNVLVQGPTGSGKTLVAASIASVLQSRDRTVALLATQSSIEEEFAKERKIKLRLGHYGEKVYQAGFSLARGEGRAFAAVAQHCHDRKPKTLIASHQCMQRGEIEFFPEEMKGCVFIVDECHHAGVNETKLGILLSELANRGARVVALTATGYRSDADEILPSPAADSIVWTMGEHMSEGFAPQRIETDVIPFDCTDCSDNVFYGTDKARLKATDTENLASKVANTWVEVGCPKVVVRVPSMPSGALETVRKIAAALKKKGAKNVVNASGYGLSVRRNLDKVLAEERKVARKNSTVDAIVGCMRIGEAMDWQHCDEAFCIGVPKGIQTTVQILGRATRDRKRASSRRPKGSPWANMAAIRFFAPVAGGKIFNLTTKQQWHALSLCAALHAETNEAYTLRQLSKIQEIDCSVPSAEGKTRSPNSHDALLQGKITAVTHRKLHELEQQWDDSPITVEMLRNELEPFDFPPSMVDDAIARRLELSGEQVRRRKGEIVKSQSVPPLPNILAASVDQLNSLCDRIFESRKQTLKSGRTTIHLDSAAITEAGLAVSTITSPVNEQTSRGQRRARALHRIRSSGRRNKCQ